MIAVVVVLAVLLLAAVAGLVLLSRPTGVSRRLRSRMVVTLKSGASFDGVLYSADRQVWVLRDAQALGAGDRGTNVPVDGEVLIHVADVEYAQKP